MCQIVVINRGEKEIRTVKEFKEYFKCDTIVPDDAYDKIEDDCCLCQIDVDKELQKLNMPYGYDYSDYYVGQLEILKADCADMKFWQPDVAQERLSEFGD